MLSGYCQTLANEIDTAIAEAVMAERATCQVQQLLMEQAAVKRERDECAEDAFVGLCPSLEPGYRRGREDAATDIRRRGRVGQKIGAIESSSIQITREMMEQSSRDWTAAFCREVEDVFYYDPSMSSQGKDEIFGRIRAVYPKALFLPKGKVKEARNSLVEEFIKSGTTHLMFFDTEPSGKDKLMDTMEGRAKKYQQEIAARRVGPTPCWDHLVNFAKAECALEREACSKIVDGWDSGARWILAETIRARGTTDAPVWCKHYHRSPEPSIDHVFRLETGRTWFYHDGNLPDFSPCCGAQIPESLDAKRP